MKVIKVLQTVVLTLLCFLKVEVEAIHRSILKWENDVRDKIEVFGPKLAKDNNLDFLNTGIGVILEGNRVAWDVNLKADRCWTIEQARPVVVKMIHEFLNLVYKDPVFKTQIIEQHKRTAWFSEELGPDRVGIKLAFWDKNVDRPLPPYLAQIRVVDGKILYFQANPADQSLQKPPFSETIEEAFGRVNRTLIYP